MRTVRELEIGSAVSPAQVIQLVEPELPPVETLVLRPNWLLPQGDTYGEWI